MLRLVIAMSLAAGLHCGSAVAQAAPAPPHAGHGAKEAAVNKPPAPAAKDGAGAAYRSPFADYRPFTAEEPPKDWRAANDEVREAGGHAGHMKAARDASKAEAAQGARR